MWQYMLIFLLLGCGEIDKAAVPALRDSIERERADQEEIANLKAENTRLKRDLGMAKLDKDYLTKQVAGLVVVTEECKAALEALKIPEGVMP